MSETRTPKFWCWTDCEERLNATTIQESVEEYEEHIENEEDEHVMPATLTLYGYAPMQAKYGRSASDVCEYIIETLDEELSDPDGSATEPTPAMLAAAQSLIDVIEREYEAWACEQVCAVTVDTATFEIVEDGK